MLSKKARSPQRPPDASSSVMPTEPRSQSSATSRSFSSCLHSTYRENIVGSRMKLQGIFIDTTTPFDHNGTVYKVKVQHNLEKWNRTTVAGYVICGSTGEGVLLSSDEKSALWEMAAQYAAPEKLLIAGAIAEGVQETVSLVNRAAGLGLEAALVEAPRYYPDFRRPDAQLLYFRTVADRASIPLIAGGISSELVAQLSQHPN